MVAAFALSGCATIYNPATEQQEFIFITTPTEVSVGNIIATKISKQFKISEDPEKIDRVTKIGEKLAWVSDRRDLKYHFKIIEDEGLNAFTSPGGYIYVNSGVVEKATDDELACVIGHEVGHVAARHIAKKLQAQLGYDILMNIATRKGGLGELQRAASISFDLIMRGYSREDELQADKLGSKYAYKSGYDPYAMITFLKKLQETKNIDLGFIFLRTHPYTSQRIEMLKSEIPTIIEKVDQKSTTIVGSLRKQKGLGAPSMAGNKTRPLKVMCPICRRIFSGKTNYCPYDGTRLQ